MGAQICVFNYYIKVKVIVYRQRLPEKDSAVSIWRFAHFGSFSMFQINVLN